MPQVCLSLEHGVIPPNVHYNIPNPKSDSLCDGTFKVVTVPTPMKGIVAISSFGIGGSNVHMLLCGPNRPQVRVQAGRVQSPGFVV